MVVCFSFVSCNSKKKSNKTTETTSVTDESLIGAPDYGETIDIDELMTKITIDGVPISLPFTIEDLGEGWSLENLEFWDSSQYCFDLLHNGNVVATTFSSSEYNLEKLNDIPITGLISNVFENLSVYGFSKGDTTEELLFKFGNPSKYYKNYNLDSMTITYENDKYTLNFVSRQCKIDGIIVNVW
jgi:hypothetical protein